MNILLTNDDGISAEGISALYDVLSEGHSVFVIAPAKERSACSNAITVRSDVRIEMHSESKYSVHGYPADCVNIGLNSSLFPPIDCVISGINHGPNLGEDVHFSGTVAAARTALIFGVPGIALSLDCLGRSDYFKDASGFLLRFIEGFLGRAGVRSVYLNINYPDIPLHKILGVRYTFLGKREYRDSYSIIHQGETELRLVLNGTIESPEIEGSDVSELRKGYISVSPLRLDCTDYSFLHEIGDTERTWPK
jgi:5'-nucleotidase